PGEKMFEELLNEKEVHKDAVFPKFFIGKAVLEQEDEVHYLIERFDGMTSSEISEFVLNLANKRKNNILLMAE
ncbi:hypothetical protein D8T51_23975, partial [Vibrio vulnificus]